MLSILMRLIGRLSVGRKLVLIYALDLSAVIFVSSILINEKFIAIDFARKEIVGNHYIAVVRDALLALPNGPASKPHGNALRSAETTYGAGMDSQTLAGEFARALDAASGPQMRQATPAGQALITRIGNQSNLILDPDLDSYYTMSLIVLRFPELYELIDLIGNKITERSNTPPADLNRVQTEYLILEGRLDAIAKGIEADYAEAFAAGQPALKAELVQARDTLRWAINVYRESARQIVIEDARGAGSPDMGAATRVLRTFLNEAWTASGSMLDRLLNARVDALFQRMWLHLGAAAALLLLILSVVYFVARQIAVPIRRLAHVADRVRASGSYELRAEWDSGDELGRLVSGFNSMLAQLNYSRLSELHRSESTYRSLFDNMLNGFVYCQMIFENGVPVDFIYLKVNTAFETLTGLKGVVGKKVSEVIPGLRESDPYLLDTYGRVATSGNPERLEVFVAAQQQWFLLSLYSPQPEHVVVVFDVITERKLAELELGLAATAFEAQVGIFITDTDGVILRVNRAFTEETGYSADEAVGKTPRLLKSGRHNVAFYAAMWECIRRSGVWQGEIWDRRKNGEIYPKWMVVTAVKGNDGVTNHYVSTQTDITERKAAEEEIKYLAFYDPLTRLPNRRLLFDRLRQALAASIRSQRQGALLFIDLDDFKTLNDTLGHNTGDLLLQHVAQRLAGCVRDGDTVARLGGDEFVVMLEDLSQEINEAAAQAEIVGTKILAALNRTYLLGAREYRGTPSIGVALFGDKYEAMDELLKQADLAMYQAKAAGRNALRFFDPQMQAAVTARVALESELRYAVREEQFVLHYQAQVDDEGCLRAAEVLVRWQHPQRGLVFPDAFIPLAEETGLILPLGLWVLETACAQLATWAAQTEASDLALAVNVSVHQLRQPDFVEQVLAVLERTGADPRKLKLELTESQLMDNVEETIAKMSALKSRGVCFALDDFGTGYSSLAYLKRLPLEKLKIDRSFVMDVLTDPNDAAIAKIIVALANSLGLGVIAEGVETEEQRDFLARNGCHVYQGYLFSKPLPLEDFERFLSRRGQRATVEMT